MLLTSRYRYVLVLEALATAACLTPHYAVAQDQAKSPDGLWTAVAPIQADQMRTRLNAAAPGALARGQVAPDSRNLFRLDRVSLKAVLDRARAPEDRFLELNAAVAAGRAVAAPVRLQELNIPLPDKTYARFRIEPTRVLSPGLAAKYPQIQTFRGYGVDDPTLKLKIDDTPIGFHAQITCLGKKTIYVDPVEQRTETYTSYAKSAPSVDRGGIKCLVPENAGGQPPAQAGARPAVKRSVSSATVMRTYRLAVACTGEYAAQFLEPGMTTPTKPGALSGIVVTVNRVNSIYESEYGVHMVLVDNTDDVLFTDPNTDGLDNNNADNLIGQSQALIDRVIERRELRHRSHGFNRGWRPGKPGLRVRHRAQGQRNYRQSCPQGRRLRR